MIRWTVDVLRRLAPDGIEAAGIGAPGPTDPRHGVLVNPPNLAGWPAGLPLGPLLTEALGAPVHLENDANLAAVAEFRRGAGRGTSDMAYVTWSTGIGSGLISGGRLHTGAHGTAGEIGHMVLDPEGPLCLCGMRGCTEAYASGNSIGIRAGRPAAEVFADARAGDPEAVATVREAAHMVGIALLNLVNIFDPELIVLGGGITDSWELVEGWLQEPLLTSPFVTPERRPRLVRAELGPEVGLVGAIEWALTKL
jgi:glucokinase